VREREDVSPAIDGALGDSQILRFSPKWISKWKEEYDFQMAF
jgi:hypothetical protein